MLGVAPSSQLQPAAWGPLWRRLNLLQENPMASSCVRKGPVKSSFHSSQRSEALKGGGWDRTQTVCAEVQGEVHAAAQRAETIRLLRAPTDATEKGKVKQTSPMFELRLQYRLLSPLPSTPPGTGPRVHGPTVPGPTSCKVLLSAHPHPQETPICLSNGLCPHPQYPLD